MFWQAIPYSTGNSTCASISENPQDLDWLYVLVTIQFSMQFTVSLSRSPLPHRDVQYHLFNFSQNNQTNKNKPSQKAFCVMSDFMEIWGPDGNQLTAALTVLNRCLSSQKPFSHTSVTLSFSPSRLCHLWSSLLSFSRIIKLSTLPSALRGTCLRTNALDKAHSSVTFFHLRFLNGQERRDYFAL